MQNCSDFFLHHNICYGGRNANDQGLCQLCIVLHPDFVYGNRTIRCTRGLTSNIFKGYKGEIFILRLGEISCEIVKYALFSQRGRLLIARFLKEFGKTTLWKLKTWMNQESVGENLVKDMETMGIDNLSNTLMGRDG
ncbi:hypothetical protein WA026_016122 [Henosepilachna vigintioctopunctata]|uniref:LAGLIDADG homing endonuclease n=1 Tax=Henosepilachna vigintioctopunctata TaxID=420089 RepID=A0AAW1TP51_9CUCU